MLPDFVNHRGRFLCYARAAFDPLGGVPTSRGKIFFAPKHTLRAMRDDWYPIHEKPKAASVFMDASSSTSRWAYGKCRMGSPVHLVGNPLHFYAHPVQGARLDAICACVLCQYVVHSGLKFHMRFQLAAFPLIHLRCAFEIPIQPQLSRQRRATPRK